MNYRKGAALFSSIVGGAAIMVGAFYFLMGQISKVQDKADAAALSASSVAGDVKAIRQSVEDLKAQEVMDKADINKNIDNINNKINLLLQRTK